MIGCLYTICIIVGLPTIAIMLIVTPFPLNIIFSILIFIILFRLCVWILDLKDKQNKSNEQINNSIQNVSPIPVPSTISDNQDDIKYDDIINKNVEFTDDAIYYKYRKWDGVKWTIEKQRVYAYKRSYHLAMGEPPKFHICRCSTMDSYIRSRSLEIEYRKSDKISVWVRNMDNYNKEEIVSHLPLCLNCYRKMRAQHNYIDSKMDNVEFVNSVIKKIRNAPLIQLN